MEPIKENAALPLGRVVATIGALTALAEDGHDGRDYLERHRHGDWGDLCADDHQANVDALRHGDRLLSSYRLPTGAKLWIITEADRAATSLLLPEDY